MPFKPDQYPFLKRILDQVYANEIDILNDMINALVEILEQKHILESEEWENKIKSKIEKRSKSKSYREIEFHDT